MRPWAWTCDGNDGDGAAPLVEQGQKIDGVDWAGLLGEVAYSDGDVREAVEAEGVELIAKVLPTSNGGRYPRLTSRST
ncbi:MAG: hypothetical protein ACRDYA_04860 [Egibacteraceae bacterium]